MMREWETTSEPWRRLWTRALTGLAANCRPVYGSEGESVLNEGGVYTGIWLECGPHESLTLAPVDPELAKRSHRIFYRHQRPDGQFPAYILGDRVGYGQIQQVVPIAATAWELACLTGDELFLRDSYQAAAGWDRWLAANRDARRLDLVEAFCEYDSGHDNSPRWRGVPRECPGGDARICPDGDRVPRLAPDLSASLYGGRIALAAMAAGLGLEAESVRWRVLAERTRTALLRFCHDAGSDFFYDCDQAGRRIMVKGDAGLRVLGEGVPDQAMAERIFARHILNPASFWTPYPLPSIAADDPEFIRPAPLNCWGGATQALTALRAPRWFERYGYFGELDDLMSRWLRALGTGDEFMQQMDPFTGTFSTSPGYSPAMCVAVDFIARRYGIVESPEGLSWGCALPDGADHSRFTLELQRGGRAELETSVQGSVLRLNGSEVGRVTGRRRILTDGAGRVRCNIALDSAAQSVA